MSSPEGREHPGRGPGRRSTRIFTARTAGGLGLAALTVVGLAVTQAAAAPAARTAHPAVAAVAAPAAIPAPPSGFSLTWSDDFTGAANTGVDAGTWKYDTGPGSSFGTGEIETMTNSTANVFQDGAGHLVLKALHSGTSPTSGWTSGRIETQAATFGAPVGGVVEMQASTTRAARATRAPASAAASGPAPDARPLITPTPCRSTARSRPSRSAGTSTGPTTSP